MSAKPAARKLPVGAQVGIVVGVLLLVAAAGYFLVVSSKRSQAAALETEIASVRTQLQELRIQSAVEPAEPVHVPDLFRLAKAMPDSTDMSGILLELNRIASESGIEFKSIAPGAAATVGTYQVVPVTLSFEGNFYSLSDFLFRLRNLVQVRDGAVTANGRLFSVDSIGFAQGEDQFPHISANLAVNAFVYGTATPASAPPPPTTETTTTTTTPAAPGEPPELPSAAASTG